jgi:probable rRNA maturation factor
MIDLENSTEFEIDTLNLENIANTLTTKDIELIVVKNDEIQELNKEYRNIDKPTDVLSFPMNFEVIDMPLLGSIVISTDFVQEKGYNIARRTIAKYREQLNIPVARLRKEL